MKRRTAPILRRCQPADFEAVYAIIHDAAQAYRSARPGTTWTAP